MKDTPLHHVFSYNDRDREFWDEELADWLPEELVDSHVHFIDPSFQIETVTEEMRRSYWVAELNEMPTGDTLEHCINTTLPGRNVACVAFGFPSLGWELEGSNEYVRLESLRRGWHSLAMTRPTWVGEQIDHLLSKPGCIGLKPMYTLLGYSQEMRENNIEASIFDFLPRHHLEVANARGSWITLHVPKAKRLAHPDNLREIRQIRENYPNIKLVIAHLGRSYTEEHAREGLLPLAKDPGLFFDTSAVLNPVTHRLALEHIGPDRLLYGSDNPVMYMRGRRQYNGTSYINRTSYPFHFNTDRESPEIEAKYTLYMYEDIKAIKGACEDLGLKRGDVEKIFYGNAKRLIDNVLAR